MMKILFVWPNIESRARHEANMGIAYLSAVMKKTGHQTLLFTPETFSKTEFLLRVRQYNPDLVGFSVTTHQYPYAAEYAKSLKKERDVPIIFGGFHPTLSPDSVIANPDIDMICRGEGEYPLLELVNALVEKKDPSNILNLWVKKNGKITKNPLRNLIEDLDSLPYPDREFINQEEILRNNGYRLDLATGRGCPYNCSYCCNSALRLVNQSKGKFIRKRSVDNVLGELDAILKKYQVREIHFQDDMFLLDKDWLKEFSEKYPQKYQIPFHISARVEHIDRKSSELLRKVGCVSVTIGVETGNEQLRKEVLKKRLSNKEILRARQLLRETGIKVCALSMIGVPGETPAMAQETLDFNKKLNPDWLACSIFSPYPGTALYQLCQEKGHFQKNFDGYSPSYLDEKSALILNLPTFPPKQVIKGHRKFMDFAMGKYLREKYPVLYPFYLGILPLLKTPLRKYLIKLGSMLILDSGTLRKKENVSGLPPS